MARNLLGYHDKVWNEIYKFTYTGNDQPFTLNAGTYLFVCNGAFGGYGLREDSEGNHLKVNGGTTYGIIDLNESTTFHAVVGGDGGDAISKTEPGAGGFNGGASGGLSASTDYMCGAGGGGATDIRLLPYDTNEYTIEPKSVAEIYNTHLDYVDRGSWVPQSNGYYAIHEIDVISSFTDYSFDIHPTNLVVTMTILFKSFTTNQTIFHSQGYKTDSSTGTQSLSIGSLRMRITSAHKLEIGVNNSAIGNSWQVFTSNIVLNLNNEYTFQITFANGTSRILIDDGNEIGQNASIENATNLTIDLAEYNSCTFFDNNINAIVYGITIGNGSNIYCRYTPCIECLPNYDFPECCPGFYNEITSHDEGIARFCRLTTQTPDPRAYVALDSIYAFGGTSNSGYLNTDYIPTKNTKIEMDCVLFENNDNSYEALFGSYRNAATGYTFYMKYNSTNISMYERNGITSPGDELPYNQRIKLICYKDTAKWYITDKDTIDESSTPYGTCQLSIDESDMVDCINPIIINSYNSSATNGGVGYAKGRCAKFKLFSFKIYENKVIDDIGETYDLILMKHFVPCYNGRDDTTGIFDIVNKRFYPEIITNGQYWERGPYKRNPSSYPSLNSRIMVAGGGAGGIMMIDDNQYKEGGYGGGAYGEAFYGQSTKEPYYGIQTSQSSGYAFGIALQPKTRANVYTLSSEGAGGGGGGWFGGYASTNPITNTNYQAKSGCGGSGYVYTESSFVPDGYSPNSKYQFHDISMTPATSQQSSAIIYELTSLIRDDTVTFPMIGRKEHLSLPPGEYNMMVYGASGSIVYHRTHFSKGGYSHGILSLMDGHDIYVNVGGSGLCDINGYPTSFNGGGKPTNENFVNKKYGGGASDIRIDSDSLYSRIIVAGGSGAEGGNGGYGGVGGGTEGGSPTGVTGGSNYGPGTQTSAGTSESGNYSGHFGQGGNQSTNGYAPGGGGWYGGSGNTGTSYAGGCGGSGYVLTEESYKPDGYLANNEEFYLTNAETIKGGNALPFGQSMIQIKVNSIMQSILCRDSHGLKYFNTETNEWTSCPISLSKQAFDEYGSSASTFDGLDDDFEVLFYDENEELDKLIMNIVPPKQAILLHTHRRMDGSTLMIDEEEYDKDVFDSDIKVLREKTTRDVIIAIYVNKLQSGKQEYRLYSAQMFYNGDLGAYKYISPEDQYKMKQLHTEEYYQYDQTTRPDMFDENGMMLKKQWLLPIGSGNNIPVEYRSDIVDGDVTTIHDVQYAEYQRSIYIGMFVTKGSWSSGTDNINNSYFIVKRISMVNGTLETIANIPYSTFSVGAYYKVGGMLVDGTHIYFTMNSERYIYKIELIPGEVATTVTLSTQLSNSDNMEAWGHIVWFDNEYTTISAIRTNRLLLYNIEENHWTIQSIPFNNSPQWIQSSRKTIVTSFGQYVAFIDKSTFQTKTFTLTMNSAAKYCYNDGIWYIVQKNYIYTIDESKIFDDEKTSMDQTIVLSSITNDVADAHYAGGALFITQMDSRSLIVYDLQNNVHTSIYLRWSIPKFSNSYINPAFSFKGTYFLMRNSLMYIDYSGMAKYNMGYKYNRYIGYYNQSMIEDIEYDERFVTVNNACTIVTDGDVEYDFEHSGDIASVSISKKDFNKINGMSVQYKE